MTRILLAAALLAATGCSVATVRRPAEYTGAAPSCRERLAPPIVDAAIATAGVAATVLVALDKEPGAVEMADGDAQWFGMGAFAFGGSAVHGFSRRSECRAQHVAAAEQRAPRFCSNIDGWPYCTATIDACEAARVGRAPHASACTAQP